jgi:predicted transcriptional regulator of viral defense system
VGSRPQDYADRTLREYDLHMQAVTRSMTTGLPIALARVPYGVIRPADASAVYAHPRTQVARLVDRGLLHPLARGYYAVVPQHAVGTGFRPTLEAAGYGVAAAAFGADDVVLMGLSAARVHDSLPRAAAVAVVAVPRQRRPLRLVDRNADVLFVRRDTARIDAERVRTDLGTALVTGIEQTVLDLAHRPDLGGVAAEARNAALALLSRCDEERMQALAREQRLEVARRRALAWADGRA